MSEFISGTSGAKNYFVVASNGKVRLGVKPEAIQPISKTVAAVIVRVRAARTEEGNSTAGQVVSLADAKEFEMPAEAFPNIKWEKSDSKRASCLMILKVRGDLETTEGCINTLKGMQVSDETILKLVAGIRGMTSEDQKQGTDAELMQHLKTGLDEIINSLLNHFAVTLKQEEKVKAMEDHHEKEVGVFASNIAFLKSAQEAYKSLEASDADTPSESSEETDGGATLH